MMGWDAWETAWHELLLLSMALVLCSLVGLERQLHQKSAGYRTHVIVGVGSCGFTLISWWGFGAGLDGSAGVDPSRIAAQVASGIGFLGGGVIFKGRDIVRGLTTAATIWMAAAIGMACGSGMVWLATLLTGAHLLTIFVVGPLVQKLPNPDRHRILRITYEDGHGTLRGILEAATELGFSSSVERVQNKVEDGRAMVHIDVRFIGRQPVRDLLLPMSQVSGVATVFLKSEATGHEDDEAEP
ncbi:MAG: MgtC/SapB family protein [Micropruina sp.]|uniref:MgtC/SapB family protein n=1 Tax=Micropruina sp. TaxID=2737536 RepID=UPI0039E53C77